jgi:surfeit locus 1 family protein
MLHRFLTPRWIAGHLMVILVAGVFVRLGIWQLDRLTERRAFNHTVAERIAAAPSDLSGLLNATPPEELEYRTAVVMGTFDESEEILIRSRTNDGEAGFHVVTPLVIEQGRAVLVNRGWVPLEFDDPPVLPALPPRDQTQVTGTVRDSQSAPSLGPRDPSDGVLERMYWIDIPRIQQQSSYALVPVSLELRAQVPQQTGSFPVPVPSRVLTEGSHLAYAVQWFAFALIGLGGYAALLRRSGKGGGVGESAGSR